ncbi:MAG: hypothetical protein O6952_04115, partial [Planctomycetota bacterium]|nr:hypothetical protein [Planctomycetota bacterium]
MSAGSGSGPTVSPEVPALLRWATSRLSPDGGLDAEVLLADLLGCDRAKLLAMDGEIDAEGLRA